MTFRTFLNAKLHENPLLTALVLILHTNLNVLDKYIIKNLPFQSQIAWCKIKDLTINNITNFEKLYLTSIKHEFRREQFIAGRTLIKLLAKLPGTDIDYDIHGAPFFLEHPELCISLSHSDEMVAVAHSLHGIGIDIQKHTPKISRIIHKFMSSIEIELARQTDEDLFAHYTWSAKEAMFKAYREGGIDFRKHLFVAFKNDDILKDSFEGSAQLIKADKVINYQLFCFKYLDYFIVTSVNLVNSEL